MPIEVVCDSCRSEYLLRDEHAGRKVRCKKCGDILLVPASDEMAEESVDRGYHDAFDRDMFLLNQKRMAIDEKYYVYGDDQEPILFIIRPSRILRQIGAIFGAILTFFVVLVPFILIAAATGKDHSAVAGVAGIVGFILALVACIAVAVWITPLRHIFVYSDDSKTNLLLEILQKDKFSLVRARYVVVDPTDGELGVMVKNYLYNLIRKKWVVHAPDGSIMVVAREDSLILSLLRRFFGPMLGILRTNFVIQDPETEKTIGEFNRKMTLFDRYVLDMSGDRSHMLDRRLAISLGVLLDTGERR